MTIDYSRLGLISLAEAGLNGLLLVAVAVMWRRLPGLLRRALGWVANAMRLGMHRLSVLVAGQAVEATASLGLAIVDAGDHEFSALHGRADHALCATRAGGRNRGELAPGGSRHPRSGRTLRQHGRLGGTGKARSPLLTDGARHSSPGPHVAPYPADARRCR